MVEDIKIKTQISPFAIREGEVKTFDGKDGYVSMNQITQKINLGHIGDIHFEIIELVNKYEFITSRQIMQILELKGIDIKTQEKLNNKLEQLIKTKILTRYYFSSEEGKGIYRIYSLEKMGKYILNSREIECNWQPADNTKPVAMIKKRLAGNQVIIAYMKKVNAFKTAITKPVIFAKNNNIKFKATGGGITLEKSKKEIDFVFEIIRREDEWEKKLIERLRLYKDFYGSFNIEDSNFSIMPQLIFVCEDDKHMAEVFKAIISNNITIEEIKYYFSTDLKYNEESLENSLIEFKLDDITR